MSKIWPWTLPLSVCVVYVFFIVFRGAVGGRVGEGGRRERERENEGEMLVTVSLSHPDLKVCLFCKFLSHHGDGIKIICMHSLAMTSSKPIRIFQSSDTSGFSSLDYSCSIKY